MPMLGVYLLKFIKGLGLTLVKEKKTVNKSYHRGGHHFSLFTGHTVFTRV